MKAGTPLLLAIAATSIAPVATALAQPTQAPQPGPSAPAATPAPAPGLLQVAAADGQFKTLLAAIEAAGLGPALSQTGPFTLFAPTDEAFAALPAGTVEELLKPENRERLRTLLRYHVITDAVPSTRLTGQQSSLTTASGAKLSVDGSDGLRINEARVVRADIGASNGVIHVIDAVLMPPPTEPPAPPSH
jgi:uncharacterized surface protein with fasciclin (FAS1) repeats